MLSSKDRKELINWAAHGRKLKSSRMFDPLILKYHTYLPYDAAAAHFINRQNGGSVTEGSDFFSKPILRFFNDAFIVILFYK
jgi:hypothetical protein